MLISTLKIFKIFTFSYVIMSMLSMGSLIFATTDHSAGQVANSDTHEHNGKTHRHDDPASQGLSENEKLLVQTVFEANRNEKEALNAQLASADMAIIKQLLANNLDEDLLELKVRKYTELLMADKQFEIKLILQIKDKIGDNVKYLFPPQALSN